MMVLIRTLRNGSRKNHKRFFHFVPYAEPLRFYQELLWLRFFREPLWNGSHQNHKRFFQFVAVCRTLKVLPRTFSNMVPRGTPLKWFSQVLWKVLTFYCSQKPWRPENSIKLQLLWDVYNFCLKIMSEVWWCSVNLQITLFTLKFSKPRNKQILSIIYCMKYQLDSKCWNTIKRHHLSSYHNNFVIYIQKL